MNRNVFVVNTQHHSTISLNSRILWAGVLFLNDLCLKDILSKELFLKDLSIKNLLSRFNRVFFKRHTVSLLLNVLLLLTTSSLSASQQVSDNPSRQSADNSITSNDDSSGQTGWRFSAAIGLGAISNPLIDSDDIIVPLIPKIGYQGEEFFLDNLTMGYKAIDDEHYTVYLLSYLNSDFLYFPTASNSVQAFGWFSEVTGIEPRSGRDRFISFGDYRLNDRYASYMAGAELHWPLHKSGKLNVRIAKDIAKVHYGYEYKLEYVNQSYWHDWYLENKIGVVKKSSELSNYYYGVTIDETPEGLGNIAQQNLSYQADSAVIPYYTLNTNTPINDSWTFLIALKYEHLPSEITKSPIVNDDYVVSTFVGWGYDF